MSELKDAMTASETEKVNTEKETETTSVGSSGAETKPKETEKNSEDSDVTVYWTSGGEKWHMSSDCQYIKNKEVFEGTLEEAQEANKKAPCSKCCN